MDDDIVMNQVVPPTAAHGGVAVNARKDIAPDLHAADRVVQVNPMGAAEDAVDVVKVIVLDEGAPVSPVAPRVNGTRVVAFVHHVVDFVKANQMVVAGKQDGGMGGVMNAVVGLKPGGFQGSAARDAYRFARVGSVGYEASSLPGVLCGQCPGRVERVFALAKNHAQTTGG